MSPRESVLRRLETQLEGLALVLGRATPESLSRRTAAGGWSARENIAHLGRHHEVMLERVERILGEDSPTLPAYRAEEDPLWPEWQGRRAAEVRRRLGELRPRLIARLKSLGDAHWTRVGVHSTLGPLSLEEWLEFFLDHEAHHVYVAMKRSRAAG